MMLACWSLRSRILTCTEETFENILDTLDVSCAANTLKRNVAMRKRISHRLSRVHAELHHEQESAC